MDNTWLNVVWYGLFVIVIAGYLIMDGFDMGVGMLHLVLAKTDEERRISLNSIGPVWDGNEVWLVLGGGVLFAAFPMVYASLFSGFYTAMMLVLLVLILRTVALEFRSKRDTPGWRRVWDLVFSASSAGLALLLGVAFGNVMQGVALDGAGNIHVTVVELLNPFALLIGVTTVFMLATHGAIYLSMKTDGAQLARVKHAIPRLMAVFFVLNTLVIALILLRGQSLTARYLQMPWLVVFPAAALAAVLVAAVMVRRERYFAAFLLSAAMIAGLLFSAALGMFPNLLVSTESASYNLTAYNAASQPATLQVMLVIALIGMPFVVLYTAGVYYLFRGKVRLGASSY